MIEDKIMFRRYAANTTTQAIKKALQKEAEAAVKAEVKVEASTPSMPFNPRSFLTGWIGGGMFAFAYDYFNTTAKLIEKNNDLEYKNRKQEYRLQDTDMLLESKTNEANRYSSENKALRDQLTEATAKNAALQEEQEQIRSVLMKK